MDFAKRLCLAVSTCIHHSLYVILDYTRLCRDMTWLRRARFHRGLARPRRRRVAHGKPRALARKAALPRGRGFAATHGHGHVPTTINIEIVTAQVTG